MVGLSFRMFKGDIIKIRGQGKLVKCYNGNGIEHIARNCTQPKRPQNSDYFKDKMLLMQAQENGAVLDEEELLFLAGEQANTFDADVDSQPDEHEIHNKVQQANVIDSTSVDMGNSNVIPYEQYLSVDNISVVPNCASFALNDVCVSSDNDAFFELTEREQRMDDQMRMLIQNRNKMEENLKKELHSVKLQLNSNIKNNKAKKAQPILYDGEELLKTHHVPVIVPSSEEDLELAETTRNKLHAKMNDSACVEKRAKELKANASPLPVLPPATVYPPNTPVHLVPRTLPTTSKVNIGLYVITQLFLDFEKTSKKRITPMGITEGERGFEQTKRCYLTKVIPFFNLLKEHFDGVQKSLVTEVRAMKAVFENLEAEVDQNAIDLKSSEIEWKNLLIANENLIAECLSQDVFYTVTDSALTASQFHELSIAYNVAMTCTVELEAENLNLHKKIQNDDHDNMVKYLLRLEVDNLNLQLKYQNLKDRTETSKSRTSKDAPEFDAFFELNEKDAQLQTHRNTIHKLKAQIYHLKANKSDVTGTLLPQPLESQNFHLQDTINKLQKENDCFRAKNSKIKQHYKELYDSIKITRATHIEKITSLLNEIETLMTQVKGKMPVITNENVIPKVSTCNKYAINVEPILPSQRNNRNVQQGYLNHLKDTLDTLHEIVEEARSKRTSDNSLEYACVYTKTSQELLENMIASCLKTVNKRDRYNASTHTKRNKHVTFAEPLETLPNNTTTHVKQLNEPKTNVPAIPSTGVNRVTKASRSQPRRNTKIDRTLPAKSGHTKNVEAHLKNNKSDLHKKNHVDSGISFKGAVVNSNSNSHCKTCNKCIILFNHDECVMKFLKSSNQSPVKKI
ncbi:hypothetical protein Tco_0458435 [Tanacetum coccineum]